ncbi:MAG: hypothetical protein SVX43_05700 [Cyanobacteriota bacterium]|nr:hypothetical protein [Cyanobacteriota bacterium]
MMISRENLEKEFVSLVGQYYPKAGEVIDQCYVKIVECCLQRSRKPIYYIAVYYPKEIAREVLAQQDVFKEIAENMGLTEAVCLNASHLVRDPMSGLKDKDARLWLELHWVATRSQ